MSLDVVEIKTKLKCEGRPFHVLFAINVAAIQSFQTLNMNVINKLS